MIDAELCLTPPYSKEAEQAVLGGILFDSSVLPEVVDLIKPDDFYFKPHRDIFAAMSELFRAGEPADILTVGEWLNDNGLLDPANGRPYLMELSYSVTTALNAPNHARIVRSKSMLRRMISLGKDIQAACYETSDPEEAISKAQASILSIAQEADRQIDPPMPELALSAVESIAERVMFPDRVSGLTTGFPQLDRYLSGLQAGKLIILGARPGMGKSGFALNVATHVATVEKRPVLFYSLEMDPKILMQRALIGMAESTSDLGKLRAAAEKYPQTLRIIDRPNLNISTLKASIMKQRLELGDVGLVVVDYLQLMQAPGINQNEKVSALSRGLKMLAREFKVPVLALAQLSRKVEERQDKRPACSDLRDSGAIEQDADAILFIYRDDYYNPESEQPNTAEIIIAKNRDGRTGKFDTFFRKNIVKFIDPERT